MKKLYYMFLFIMVLLLAVPENSFISLDEFKGKSITVEIKGEVENPGVYTFERGESLNDALNQAKLLESSDTASLNLTTPLANHDVIVIPKKKEEERVSINTATKQQLITIPSIGPSTADKIIEYRESNGQFQSIEDLLNIKGIGEKKLEKMREYICL